MSHRDFEDDLQEEDLEDDPPLPSADDDEEDTAEAPPPARSRGRSSRNRYDDDDEEDEDEDDEEDYNDGSSSKRKKRKTARSLANAFLDVEAEVEDDDMEDDEYGDEEVADFIDKDDIEVPDTEEFLKRDAAARRDLDRRFAERDERELADLARDLDQRHKRTNVRRYRGDASAHKSQHSLLPSVRDPKLWMIRCREGKERDIVHLVIRKAFDYQRTGRGNPVRVHSVLCRDDLKGFIYVEADLALHVNDAFDGITGVYLSRQTLVPVNEMPDVLFVKAEDKSVNLLDKKWVRIKRGKYAGDLAQVVDAEGETATVRLVPRINYEEFDSRGTAADEDGDGGSRKRKRAGGATTRPPQKLLNHRELPDHISRKMTRNQYGYWVLGGETFRDGYLEKSVRVSVLDVECAPPTLEEIERFSGGNGTINNEALQSLKLAAQERESSGVIYNPGDRVQVTSGELANVPAVVLSISNGIATIVSQVPGIFDKTSIPVGQLRKHFAMGDAVRVLAGKHAGTIGTVIDVDKTSVTVVDSVKQMEFQVFARDLADAKGTQVVAQPDAGLPGTSGTQSSDGKFAVPSLPGSRSASGPPPRAPPMPRGGFSSRGPPRPRFIGSTVKLLAGMYKGYVGLVLATLPDGQVRVRLQANQRVTLVDRNQLAVQDASGHFHEPSSMYAGGMTSAWGSAPTPGGYGQAPSSGAGWGNDTRGGRTPNPYAGAQTPNPYSGGAQTPHHYSSGFGAGDDGGRTPAWDAGSRTPYRPFEEARSSAAPGSANAWGSSANYTPSMATGSGGNDWSRGGGSNSGAYAGTSSGYDARGATTSSSARDDYSRSSGSGRNDYSRSSGSGRNDRDDYGASGTSDWSRADQGPAAPTSAWAGGSSAAYGGASDHRAYSSAATTAPSSATYRRDSSPPPRGGYTGSYSGASGVGGITPGYGATPMAGSSAAMGATPMGSSLRAGLGGATPRPMYGSESVSSASASAYGRSASQAAAPAVGGAAGGAGGDQLGSAWGLPGILVEATRDVDARLSSGARAVITRVDGSGTSVDLDQGSAGVPIDALKPVLPGKADKVLVLVGQYRGKEGTIIGAHEGSGVVRMAHDSKSFETFKLTQLGKVQAAA
ncbi:transcription elongation factor spt5 [Blastocladiella emersonii ATCC 22665]|nr:transcription elongation factor spt5 [Blastocladiella emersonii ATCC 22665]